jgi:hypothetical protein
MQVKRERETRAVQMASGTPWETVTLDDALARPQAVRAATGGGAGCGDAWAGGEAGRAYRLGRRVAPVWLAPSSAPTA